MAEATDYVRSLQKRTGQIIGSPESFAFEEALNTLSDELKSQAMEITLLPRPIPFIRFGKLAVSNLLLYN